MENHSAKRRRVYSLEPNNVVQAVFTRNYVNYLVPALMKIKERSSSQQNRHCDFKNIVKHEVDMAMVFSAQGFAWSNALKVKLQRGHVNVDTSSTSLVENEAGDEERGSPRVCDQNEMVPFDLSSNPCSKSRQARISVNKSMHKDNMPELKKGLEGEDEVVNKQLRCLRMIIPGGEEMRNEQMVSELESYISCLQMQVNILQCLAETR